MLLLDCLCRGCRDELSSHFPCQCGLPGRQLLGWPLNSALRQGHSCFFWQIQGRCGLADVHSPKKYQVKKPFFYSKFRKLTGFLVQMPKCWIPRLLLVNSSGQNQHLNMFDVTFSPACLLPCTSRRKEEKEEGKGKREEGRSRDTKKKEIVYLYLGKRTLL